MKKNKKGSELTMGQLISLILVLVVIIFVLIAIFNPVVWAWVRQLPDYKYDNSDKEIEPDKLSKEVQGSCPVVVGRIDGETDYIHLYDKKTDLLWKEDRIELDESVFLLEGLNENIASIDKNSLIKVDPKWFVYENRKKHPKLPDIEDLKLLDGAYKMFNLNGLCRVSGVKKTEIPVDSSQKAWTMEKIIERYPEANNYNFEKSPWLEIGYGMNNENNRLGFNTGGNEVTKMRFKKANEKIYIQFSDDDSLLNPNDKSPWILLNYWNEYGSIVYISQEYIIK